VIQLAIIILVFALGVIVVLGAVYLALKAAKLFLPVEGKVEQAIWLIVVILLAITVLVMISRGTAFDHVPWLR
jgi:hypothetical protein